MRAPRIDEPSFLIPGYIGSFVGGANPTSAHGVEVSLLTGLTHRRSWARQ
jgi:hypothetical protein